MIDDRVVCRYLEDEDILPETTRSATIAEMMAAGRQLLERNAPLYRADWSNDRVRIALDQLIMTRNGIDVGAIDGVEGVMTQYGWEQFQNRMRRGRGSVSLPSGSSVFCRQANAARYYGSPGSNHARIEPPYPVFYGEQPVRSITINQRCADSAMRAMRSVLAHYGIERIRLLGLDRYAGCFNNRLMRGGTRLSMHAYACAIDWDAVRNPLRADHRTAQFAKPEYAAFLDAWEAEGWTSLGRARDFDWMHIQAASL